MNEEIFNMDNWNIYISFSDTALPRDQKYLIVGNYHQKLLIIQVKLRLSDGETILK